jgi:hypothetical protein
MDTDPRTPRQIVLDMGPLFRHLCNGTDATVALALSDKFDGPDHNGLVFVAEGIDSVARQLNGLWKELDLATRGQSESPPSPLTLVTE